MYCRSKKINGVQHYFVKLQLMHYNYLGLVFPDLYKVTAVQRVIVSAVDNS